MIEITVGWWGKSLIPIIFAASFVNAALLGISIKLHGFHPLNYNIWIKLLLLSTFLILLMSIYNVVFGTSFYKHQVLTVIQKYRTSFVKSDLDIYSSFLAWLKIVTLPMSLFAISMLRRHS